MSDTPRTDAFCTTPTEYYVGQESRLIPGWIDFARQLERELAAVTEERDALAAAMPSEGADAALAYAAEKTLREKAEAECERLRGIVARMIDLAEYWINKADRRDMSEGEWLAWHATGHGSNAMNDARAAIDAARNP